MMWDLMLVFTILFYFSVIHDPFMLKGFFSNLQNRSLFLICFHISQFSTLTSQAQLDGAVEYRGVRPHPKNECLVYFIKQSDRETPALEIWGSVDTSSLSLLPGSL